MVRRIYKLTSIIFILVLILSMMSYSFAEKDYVVDYANSFTTEEAIKLEQDVKELGTKYNMDIVIVTILDAQGKSSREYGDDYFDYNGYGIGTERDGILFLMDFDNREAYISTSGSGIRYLTDERIESILDDVFDYGLSDGDIYGAANSFVKSTRKYLETGIPKEQHNVPENHNNIPGNHYSVPEPIPNTLNISETIAGALISIVFGLGFFISTKNNYKAKPGRKTFEYRKNSFVNLGITSDKLVNTYVRTRIIPKTNNTSKPSSGSSIGRSTTHRSSSGRTHGGGGRKF